MSGSGYNLGNGRVEAQINKMKELEKEGICAFCEQHFEAYHDNPIEFLTEYWIVSKNDYPYERTSLHLLLVPKQHVSMLAELDPLARADFVDTLAKIEQRWRLPSYAVGMRVGDPTLNGGTVEHLHAHVIVGELEAQEHEPVRFKMSTRRSKAHYGLDG